MNNRERKRARGSVVRVGIMAILPVLACLPVCHSAENAPLECDEHTLALWHMDEVEGNRIADATVHRRDGRVSGPILVKSGRFGNALSFDGKDDYVDCGSGRKLDLGAGDFTVEAWFRTTNRTIPYSCIVGLYGTADVWLAVTKEGSMRFGFRDAEGNSNEQLVGTGLNLNDGRYHHVVGVRAGDANIVYVDGRLLRKNVAEDVGRISSDAPWMIGSLSKGTWPFHGVIDEVRISGIARLPRPVWQGFLPGNNLKNCRTHLPLYLYFSTPMDTSRSSPVIIFDVTAGRRFEQWVGRYPGDHSCYGITLKDPLQYGHHYRIDFRRGADQFRSEAGAPFDPSDLGSLHFRTHKKGQAPRPLYVGLRNDNTHVTVEGMERMLAHGMDLIEFNLAQIKDGWISNHLLSPRSAKTKVTVVMPGRTVPDGKVGDRRGFRNIPAEPIDTSYRTYASVDYVDTTDGHIDRIPRWEELLEVIRRWDRPVHLQIHARTATRKDFEQLFRETRFDLSKVHSWHGKAITENVPLSGTLMSRNYLFYPPRGTGVGEGFTPEDEAFPNGMTPLVIRQAHENGRCTWLYSRVSKPVVMMTARLGIQYMCDNGLAYKGDPLSRQTLYELNNYEGNKPPAVESVTVSSKPLAAQSGVSRKPEIALRFSDMMELRSVNYNSVALQRAGGATEERIPLHFDVNTDFRTFTIQPQKELLADTRYRLRVGGLSTQEPLDLGGLSLETPWQATFTTGK